MTDSRRLITVMQAARLMQSYRGRAVTRQAIYDAIARGAITPERCNPTLISPEELAAYGQRVTARQRTR